MTELILVVNAGSSSVKFEVFRIAGEGAGDLEVALKGQLEGLGSRPHFVAKRPSGEVVADLAPGAAAGDHEGGLRFLGDWLATEAGLGGRLRAVGHRVVHGGAEFAEPVLVDEAVLARLEALVPLAPLHQPHNLAGIKAARARNPGLPQIACFDTAFHRSHPEVADRFALPEALYAAGIRRFGFHGLSYEYIAQRLHTVAPEVAAGRVVVGHLGSGASLCALHRGRSLDSTMGFSPIDGLPMGTRTGQIDPGALLFLMRDQGYDLPALDRLLNRESGLLGLSGISNDMRDLEASAAPAAKRAIDYFVYRTVREIGALVAVLGGLDALVFTAGIGEHSAGIRARVMAGLAWLGVRPDAAANAAHAERISAPASALPVFVIPTDEERMIAQHTLEVVQVPASA